jgi:GTP-binding protein YchF
MKAGLVGPRGSGKTTLFNALTALHRAGDGHLHLGAIKVPDQRIDALAALYKPKKTTYAEMVFADVPGSRENGLDADALKALADVDALCLVLRGFDLGDGSRVEPLRELRDFDAELVLADLGVVERRQDRLRKEHAGRTSGEYHELENLKAHLEDGKPLRTLKWSDAEQRELSHFGFLSRKPLLVVLNVAESAAGEPLPREFQTEQRSRGADGLALCASIEAEIAELDPAEQPAFLESLGVEEPARDRFIRAAYRLLELTSFFTVGEDEVKAWTIHRGDKAAHAAGRIHSDFERTFIRAEVIHYEDFMSLPGEPKARERAKSRLEGKEYIVRDGDILHVRAGA